MYAIRSYYESRERVQAALKNSGFEFPIKKITVNLAPADIKKEGSQFDLPIAIGVLAATEKIEPAMLQDSMLLGELSLDGQLRPVKGALSIAAEAKRAGYKRIILPKESSSEAAIVDGIEVYGMENLFDVVQFLNGELSMEPVYTDKDAIFAQTNVYQLDFSDVKGQENVKRARITSYNVCYTKLLRLKPMRS